MIFFIGILLIIISIQILLLSIDSKLDKIMIAMNLKNKHKKIVKIDREIEKIRKDFL